MAQVSMYHHNSHRLEVEQRNDALNAVRDEVAKFPMATVFPRVRSSTANVVNVSPLT
eukprot:m.546545 g.546545  ORF g.546545 m.546545 type:complete len:57 (+) comp57690_c0_seq4:1350-1520(+)